LSQYSNPNDTAGKLGRLNKFSVQIKDTADTTSQSRLKSMSHFEI